MNVYLESNFILEIILKQDQEIDCKEIIKLAEESKINLLIPAFTIAEVYEVIIKRSNSNKEMAVSISDKCNELLNSSYLHHNNDEISKFTDELVQSEVILFQSLKKLFERLFPVSTILPIEEEVILKSLDTENFGYKDSVIYHTIVEYLKLNSSEESCFINKNRKDFKDPDIIKELTELNCKILYKFNDGVGYIKSRLS